MRAFHAQFTLTEEVLQRIFQAITRHLQNALIDSKQRHLLRAVRHHRHGQIFARLNHFRRIHFEVVLTRFGADFERHHAVAQRAHEDFVGIHIPHELHVDIAVAFHSRRYADFLHRTGGVSVEPLPAVHFIFLDGDQPAAGVRRVD
ncbi:hypothetical protein D3C80_1354300 [compost metagenome]